jgi:hypothetical protein
MSGSYVAMLWILCQQRADGIGEEGNPRRVCRRSADKRPNEDALRSSEAFCRRDHDHPTTVTFAFDQPGVRGKIALGFRAG